RRATHPSGGVKGWRQPMPGEASCSLLELRDDRGEDVLRSAATHEHVEVGVAVEDVESRATAGVPGVPGVRGALALGCEALVQGARQKHDAGVGGRGLGGEVMRQLGVVLDGEQAACLYAAQHLSEEGEWNGRELVAEPLVCEVVEVLMAP